jgi:hypothetical protein
MLSATVNAAKSAQNCPNLPKSAKDETLKFRQKSRFWYFSKFQRVEGALEHVSTVRIFNPRIFHMLFLLSKSNPLYLNFSIPPCGK